MKRPLTAVPLLLAAMLSGCAGIGNFITSPIRAVLPQSLGSELSGYTYVPLDPLAVTSTSCERSDVLASLPDIAIRYAVATTSFGGREPGSDATLQMGSNTVGVAGNTYSVVMDYVNADTANVPFLVYYDRSANDQVTNLRVSRIDDEGLRERVGTQLCYIGRNPDGRFYYPNPLAAPLNDGVGTYEFCQDLIVPVYIGVGMRITANVRVLRGSVNISSLGDISSAVQAGRATGTMVMQTLGISGRPITSTLTIPQELNQTTIQQAIQTMATIKEKMYEQDGSVFITPRVTGMYLPFEDSSAPVVNAFVSQLGVTPVPWSRQCRQSPGASTTTPSTTTPSTPEASTP